MKKVLLFLALLSLTATIFAQKQTGYVRTIHKASKPAKYINGAVITSKENNNVAKSKDGGSFEIPVATVKGKKGYTITKVELNGYNLVDEKLLNKFKTYSLSPIEIVLISKKDEEIQTKALIEKREKALKAEYEKQIKELKGDYSKIEQLNRNYEQQLKDLPDLVKRLVYLDYKNLTNELDISIAEAYENGDFAKAIELINQKPDLKTRSEQNKQLKEAVEKETETIIRECDIKIDYFKSIFKYDSALYYMEIKLEQDPENIGCLFDAGNISATYLADYNKALEYYNKALNISLKFGEKNEMVAASYNNIGAVYSDKGDYDKALTYYQKALDIYKQVLPENHPDIATSYNNIGAVYSNKGDYDMALNYYQKALDIRKQVLPENHPDIATSYSNRGVVYYHKEEYVNALINYAIALYIRKQVLPENHPDIATLYDNIGDVHFDEEEYNTALFYYTKALDIQNQVLPENHPDIATSYFNIGDVYFDKEEYDSAFTYHQKALDIRQQVLPENHSNLVISYYNTGYLYALKKDHDYNKSIEYLNNALKIARTIYPEDSEGIKEIKRLIQAVQKEIKKG